MSRRCTSPSGRPVRATLSLGLGVLLAFAALAGAQTWTPLNHQPTFPMGTALLLTDGTVMVQQVQPEISGGYGTGQWWRLTPDIAGSYQNGTWSQLATMPAGYAPLYYASAVLADGRVVVEGGEYNVSGDAVWTWLGAIYNPASNAWTSIAPPAGWTSIGDAQSVVLTNGTFMLANARTAEAALLNTSTLTWTPTGSGKADINLEEGWTLLPNGKVLTIDTANGTNSEIYNPSTGSWSSAGSTCVQLAVSISGYYPEIGPAVLRPDGTVFATGATSNTAIYNSASGSWIGCGGPIFPNGLGIADGPAALLPNGNVLVDASPGFSKPSQFFEFNGASLIAVPAPPRASVDPALAGRMLVLPTGQILFTDGSTDVEVYTPSGTYQSAWQPTINSFPSSVTAGTANYFISGWQFNGLSQGAMYGDDAQSATNYPLVRIINNATGHVSYAKTHNHSTMAVATGNAVVSTQFDVPAGIETGASQLEVVANGIPSPAVTIQVVGAVAGTGLKGEYFTNAQLSGSPALVRTDATIDYDWAVGSPHPTLPVDWFSVRWTGQVQAQYTQTYTFYTRTDDGVRLWVNGQLLIDKWVGQASTEWSGSINLTAGQLYNITMEYFDGPGNAEARLLWSSLSTPKQVIPSFALFYPGVPPGAVGTGLTGEYFNNAQLSGSPALVRTDATVNYDWAGGSPHPSLPSDWFSVRWTGLVQAQHTQTYTFYTRTDDGVRLWVNGQLLIDKWVGQSSTEWSGSINLTAGQLYNIKMEYFDGPGNAEARLLWSSPSTPKQVIPQGALFLTPGSGLRGEYFNNAQLSGSPALVRTDPTINYDWAGGSPHPTLPVDWFSVRWTGQVRTQYTQSYTFYTRTDDGVRLWVNGQLLIDKWVGQSSTEWSGSINLVADQMYSIKMEYFDGPANAEARLLWSSPSTPKQAIPQGALYP